MRILSLHCGHNASAAMMIDGQIVGMIQEERLTRCKNQTGFPLLAARRLVDKHLDGVFDRVDKVVVAGREHSLFWTALDHYSNFDVHDFVSQMHDYWYPYFYGESKKDIDADWVDDYWRDRYLRGDKLNKNHNYDFSFIRRMSAKEAYKHFNDVERFEALKRHFEFTGPVELVGHHRSHAHWAYFGAPLSQEQQETALVMTADSRGDFSNWSVSIPGEDGQLRRIARGSDNALARIYKFTTLILGMKPNEHEYKVMGLASYSNSCTPVSHVYLGDDAADVGSDWKSRIPETGVDIEEFGVWENVDTSSIARMLAADMVVARCVGSAEFGARALGNRSILANPSNPQNLAFINNAIKQRDFWMPFTPSILAEESERYLVNEKACSSPYMTIGFETKPETRHEIIAALHPADFSARPQFVERSTNPDYWELISAFHQETGIPALLNTSLNLHGEPMNYAVEDAARTLALSDLKFLSMPDDRLLYKRSEEESLTSVLGGAYNAVG